MDYQVKFLAKRWGHHSQHSGYHQLVRYLGEPLVRPEAGNVVRTKMPGRLAVWLARRSNVRHYTRKEVFHEWAAFRDMVFQRPPTIYHILYGDDSFRYLRRGFWSGRHRVMATFHQPSGTLAQSLTHLEHVKRLDAVIVVANSQFPFFERLVGKERVFFVPHGVDTDVFHPLAKDRPAGRCLFVGGHKRDFQMLAEVLRRLRRRGVQTLFTLVTPRSKWRPFENMANVELKTGVPEEELVSLYQRSSLLLQPLEASTANNAILEGMACGTPIVASDVGGVADYVDDSCGRLVSTESPEAMVEAVVEILEDEPLRQSMSANARARALAYDWREVARTMRDVYERVLSQSI